MVRWVFDETGAKMISTTRCIFICKTWNVHNSTWLGEFSMKPVLKWSAQRGASLYAKLETFITQHGYSGGNKSASSRRGQHNCDMVSHRWGHWKGIAEQFWWALGGHWWALVGIESDIVSMDVQARSKVGVGIVEETYGEEEWRTKLFHKTRCTKRTKKRGSRTLYNIKREKKGPVAYVLGIS